MKTIDRQKQQRMWMEDLFKNKVSKLINKVLEWNKITINNKNDIGDNLTKPLEERQLQLLNQLLMWLMDNKIKFQLKLKQAEFVMEWNL